jgi:cytoskeletal protein CcmA (bactofilin family)
MSWHICVDGGEVGDIAPSSDAPAVVSEEASVCGQIHADHVIINGCHPAMR